MVTAVVGRASFKQATRENGKCREIAEARHSQLALLALSGVVGAEILPFAVLQVFFRTRRGRCRNGFFISLILPPSLLISYTRAIYDPFV